MQLRRVMDGLIILVYFTALVNYAIWRAQYFQLMIHLWQAGRITFIEVAHSAKAQARFALDIMGAFVAFVVNHYILPLL